MLVTGGGGYTKHNVARCWTHETATLLGVPLPDALPASDYHAYYAPDYTLGVRASRAGMEDMNTKQVERRGVGVWGCVGGLYACCAVLCCACYAACCVLCAV